MVAAVTIGVIAKKALKLYIEQKNTQVEDELISALNTLYQKNVPSGVREYIDMRSGNSPATTPKVRRTKLSSVVGDSEAEVTE